MGKRLVADVPVLLGLGPGPCDMLPGEENPRGSRSPREEPLSLGGGGVQGNVPPKDLFSQQS